VTIRDSKLTDLQNRLLKILAATDPPWTLVGGGALAAVHLRHRTTRDLDLFWRGLIELGELPVDVERQLREAALSVEPIQRSATFVRLRVADHQDTVILDLVADPSAEIEPDGISLIDGVEIRVAGKHAILVSKLCALLSRSELRDLIDVRALLDAGGDLDQALRDAPAVDGGFSPLTLAWVLESLEPERLAEAAGVVREEAVALIAFRSGLVKRLLGLTKPAE